MVRLARRVSNIISTTSVHTTVYLLHLSWFNCTHARLQDWENAASNQILEKEIVKNLPFKLPLVDTALFCFWLSYAGPILARSWKRKERKSWSTGSDKLTIPSPSRALTPLPPSLPSQQHIFLPDPIPYLVQKSKFWVVFFWIFTPWVRMLFH